MATVAPARAPRRPRLTEIARTEIAASAGSGRRPDEVRMIEQIEEVCLERHSRSFIDFKILGDVEIYVSPGRTDQTVALDRRVAPQAVVDRSGASEANPIRIGQTKRRTSPCQLVGDDSAFWNQPICPIAILVRIRTLRIEWRPGVTRLIGDDRVGAPPAEPTIAPQERQVVADCGHDPLTSIEICAPVIEVRDHVVGGPEAGAIVEEIADVVQGF